MSEAIQQRNMRVTPPYSVFDLSKVGGAVVRRAFTGRKVNDILSIEEVRKIKPSNLKALVALGNLELFPKSETGHLFLRKADDGLFEVCEVKSPKLSHDEAKALLRASKN